MGFPPNRVGIHKRKEEEKKKKKKKKKKGERRNSGRKLEPGAVQLQMPLSWRTLRVEAVEVTQMKIVVVQLR